LGGALGQFLAHNNHNNKDRCQARHSQPDSFVQQLVSNNNNNNSNNKSEGECSFGLFLGLPLSSVAVVLAINLSQVARRSFDGI